MSDPLRQPPVSGQRAPTDPGRGGRNGVVDEDPLAELARILGETMHPVRPENLVEVGRRTLPQRPAPQQVSELEAELFETLRASVAPEDRVRGSFEREVAPVIPQHPVDDHDIASIGAWAAPEPEPQPAAVVREAPRAAPRPAAPSAPAAHERLPEAYFQQARMMQAAAPVAPQPPAAPAPAQVRTQTEAADPRWADYYAYDDGISAGSYDPAFDHSAPVPAVDLDAAFAAEIRRNRDVPGREAAAREPTFDDFDQAAIAAAAREASPYADEGAVIRPHSAREEYAARQMPREGGGKGFRIAATLVGLVLLGGGGLAAWKTMGSGGGAGAPAVILADGKPLKILPDPTKAAPGDDEISLKRDTAVAGSKIVSLQEDPVEHVPGRTSDGREVRVINPGAPRAATADQPHSVKTVVVRPDGSIVSDEPPKPAAPVVSAMPPQAEPPMPATPPTPAVPKVSAVPPVAAQPPSMPSALPPVPRASPDAPAPIKTVTVTPVQVAPPTPTPAPKVTPPPTVPQAAPPVQATPPVKTVTTTPIVPPKPVAPPKPATTAAPTGGAPMALGAVPPKLASAPQPQAAPPKPVAPPQLAPPPAAASGGGDWMVQLSASGSDAAARSSFAAAQRKHPGLAGKSVDVQRADLGAKGVFFRARVAAGSREAAAALCQQIQSQGGQCMVTHR